MTFLPEHEKQPEGNYFKLQDGENTFRVLSSAITGYQYWNNDKKPIRLKEQPQGLPEDIRVENGKPGAVKYFWAFAVYSYRAQKVQILEVTQASIQNAIRSLVANTKWGDPKGYDISITRTGMGMDTEYSIMPNPHTPFEASLPLPNLEALYSGEDPFAKMVMPETPAQTVDEIAKALDLPPM